MWRRRQGNSTLKKTNNSTENLVGNVAYEYPVPDHNRTMINIAKELNDIHKKHSKSQKRSLRNSWKRY
jgi:hypothetical protein